MASPFAKYVLVKYDSKRYEPKLFADAPQSIISKTTYTKGQIYPNPTNNILNLPKNCKGYEILDMNGKTILSKENLINSQINVESLEPGMYIIRLINDDKTISLEKFSKL